MEAKKILAAINDLSRRLDNIGAIELPVTLEKLSQETGLNMSTLYGYHRDGKIPTFKLGPKKIMIYKSEFNTVMRSDSVPK